MSGLDSGTLLVCRHSEVGYVSRTTLATVVMEISTKSWKRPSIAELDPCTSQSLYRTPKQQHRFLRPRPRAQERGYGKPKASSPTPEADRRRRRSSYVGPDKPDEVSVWDSNAEGIRGNWRARENSSLGSRLAEDSSNPNAFRPEDSSQWWKNGPGDDEYAVDDDDDEEEDSWFSLDDFDISPAISMLRWMLPAAALILPWFFGGPMFLMAALAFFPFVRKLFWAALQGWWNGSSRSRRRDGKKARFWKHSKFDSDEDSREESQFFSSDVEDWETSFLRSSLDRESNSKLGGGWGADNDGGLMQKKPKRRRKQKVALERRWSRNEMPLFLRLLVALFPFLRSWGGFL